MQALSTRKTNPNQFQDKRIPYEKTIGNCAYHPMWTNKNKGIEQRTTLYGTFDDYSQLYQEEVKGIQKIQDIQRNG